MSRVSSAFVAVCTLLVFASTARPLDAPGFAAPRQFAAGTTAVRVKVADFDGDGRADIASADRASPNAVTVRRKNPAPVATPYAQQTYRDESVAFSGTIDDAAYGLLDSQFLDVVCATGGGLVVALNTGPGPAPNDQLRFTVHAALTAGAGAWLDHVRVADWNGDGTQDLVATGHDALGGGILAVFPNLGGGTGSFGQATLTTLTHPVFGLELFDFTNDGRVDAAVIYRDDDAVGVIANPADGTFGAVNETIVTLAAHPVAVVNALLHDANDYAFSDLVVAGSGRSSDGTRNQVTLSVAQNLSKNNGTAPFFASKRPSFGTSATFLFGGAVGPAAILPTAVAATTLLPGAAATLALTDDARGVVTIVGLSPTLAAGVVASWGTPQTFDFPCNAHPLGVVFADVDGVDALVDLVTSNGAGNGVNVLLGGDAPASSPLAAATGLTVEGMKAGKGTDGKPLLFSCASSETDSGVNALSIRVQSSATPDDEPSWTDLPGGGVMLLAVQSRKWLLSTRSLPTGAQYFRTVTYAPGRLDGVDRDGPTTTSPTRVIGPFTILPGPAQFALTASLFRFGGGGSVVHRGEQVQLDFRWSNVGDKDATGAFVAGRLPDGCTVVQAGGGSTAIPGWIVWGPRTFPAHGEDILECTAVVGPSVKDGADVLVSKGSAMGKLKLKVVKGAITGAKGFVVAATSNALSVESSLGVTVVPDTLGVYAGDVFTTTFIVVNRTTLALTDVVFTEKIPREAQFVGAQYLDALGAVVAGPTPTLTAARDSVSFFLGAMERFETRTVRLELRVHYDHPPEGGVTLSGYRATGVADGAVAATTLTDAVPPVKELAVTGRSTHGFPEMHLVEAINSPHAGKHLSPRFGLIPFALPGESVQYVLRFRNGGSADAERCVVHATLPPGTALLDGTFTLDGNTLPAAPVSGSAIDMDVGTLAPGVTDHGLAFRVRILEAGEVGAPAAGDVIATRFASITSDSLTDPVYMDPVEVGLYVATTVHLFISDKAATRSGLAGGETMTLTYTITNAGALDAVDVTAKFGWPKQETCLSGTVDGATTAPFQGKLFCSYPLGTIAAGRSKVFAATVRLDGVPPSNAALLNTLDVVGTAKSATKAGATPSAAHDDEFTNVCGPGRPFLFVALAVNSIAATDDGADYLIVVGNTGDTAARGVVVETKLPEGTKLSEVRAHTPGMKSHNATGTVSWSLGDVPAHSTKSVFLPVAPGDSLGVGDSIVQDAIVTSTNAAAKVSARVTTTLFGSAEIYAGLAANRPLYVNGIAYAGGNSTVDAALSALDADSVNVQIRGADFVALANGALVIPLGGDNVLAFGTGQNVFAHTGDAAAGFLEGDIRLHHGADVFGFVGGASTSVQTPFVGHVTVATARDVLERLGDLVPYDSATVVSSGGCNLVRSTGDALVANRAGAFPTVLLKDIASIAGSAFLATGGGSLVAAGGGNLVAAGGGNVVSHDGGSLTAVGTASMVLALQSTLVAAGGGNVVSHDGGSVVSHDGGSLVSAGAGNLVAAGAGNVVSHDGGSLVAAGGGN